MQTACVGMFICVCSPGCENVLAGVWLWSVVPLSVSSSRSPYHSVEKEQLVLCSSRPKQSVSLTTAGPWSVFSRLWQSRHDSDISGGSLNVMSGCDGSILHPVQEGGRCNLAGANAELLQICQTQVTLVELELKSITSLRDGSPLFKVMTWTSKTIYCPLL